MVDGAPTGQHRKLTQTEASESIKCNCSPPSGRGVPTFSQPTSMSELSAYELERLANIKRNEEVLRQLGLISDTGTPVHKFATAAAPSQGSKRKGLPPLSAAQRAALADASGWLERFELWLRDDVSAYNADKVMERVRELVSGSGVELSGLGGPLAFEGRLISISDDLEALRAEASAKYGAKGNGRDAGGWFLRHPIGKLIKFQQVLYSTSHPEGADDSGSGASFAIVPAIDRSWLVPGAEVEVEMCEEGLHDSRYAATVLSIDSVDGVDGEKATVRYAHLLMTGEEESQPEEHLVEEVKIAALRPTPPRAVGFASKLHRGSICELWHQDGWWPVKVANRVKGKPAVTGGRVPATRYEVYSERYGEIDDTVLASHLRPRFALLCGTDWLALPPVGQKCALSETEMIVGEEEEEVTAEEMAAERAAAEAKRQVAITERLAAKEVAARARADKQAAKVRERSDKQAARAAAVAEKQVARGEQRKREEAKQQQQQQQEEEEEEGSSSAAEATCYACVHSKCRKRRQIASTWIEGNWLLLCDGQGCSKVIASGSRPQHPWALSVGSHRPCVLCSPGGLGIEPRHRSLYPVPCPCTLYHAALEALLTRRSLDRAPSSQAYHTLCLQPQLDAVPSGDWFCPACTLAKNQGGPPGANGKELLVASHPRAESLRSYLFGALCAGRVEREDVLKHVAKASANRYSQKDVVTVLGKEMARAAAAAAAPALWVQDGSRYTLTAEGEELAKDVRPKQKKQKT